MQFNPKLKINAFLPSSSSIASSSSAFLSLSWIITRFAMEAKVRFIGAVEEVAGGMVEAAVEEEEGESVGVLWAKLDDVEEADESSENDDILGIWVEEQVTSVFLFEAGEDGFVETVLDAGVEDTAGDFVSKEAGESIGLETVWVDGWEE